MAFVLDAIFFGAISSFTLYLFLPKESKKRMPFQSGLYKTPSISKLIQINHFIDQLFVKNSTPVIVKLFILMIIFAA
jgi:hypothetical protein